MNEITGIDDLIERINRLDVEIADNKEVIPLVRDMFTFIKDLIPLMLKFSAFIRNDSKKIPTATENLNAVSHTTERMTHEILDRLEIINKNIDEMKSEVSKSNNTQKILQHIQNLENLASEIYYSFQFQDITAQKLEYVNRVLQAIYERFIDLFESSLKIQGRTIFGQDIVAAIERELQKGKQQKALQKFRAQTTDLVHENGVSQEIIDKYFEKK